MKDLFAIYARKSKYSEKGESILSQVDMCKNFILQKYGKNKENLIKVFSDEGFTGANTNRPSFTEMFNELKSGNYCCLVTYRMDRISRNVLDFCNFKDFLSTYQITFISITENFDTSTPLGNAMILISSIFAQLERDTIAERIKDNMYELSKTGRWLGGSTPLGFRSIKKEVFTSSKKRSFYTLQVIDEEITIVKFIFKKFLELKTLNRLEMFLKKENIKTKRNSFYTKFALYHLLTNLVYCKNDQDIKDFFDSINVSIFTNDFLFDGKRSFITYHKSLKRKNKIGKRNNIYLPITDWIIAISNHEGIIDGKTFIECYKLLHLKKRKEVTKKKNPAVLSGIITCPYCNSYLRVKLRNTLFIDNVFNFSYVCELKEKSKKIKCCYSNIHGNIIDKEVILFLSRIPFNNSFIDSISNIYFNDNYYINEKIKRIDNTISTYVDKLLYIDKENLIFFNEQLTSLNKEKKELLEILKKEENNIDWSIDKINSFCSFLISNEFCLTNFLSRDSINGLVNSFVKNVFYDNDILYLIL